MIRTRFLVAVAMVSMVAAALFTATPANAESGSEGTISFPAEGTTPPGPAIDDVTWGH
ncbi:hypothetical protein ACIO87_23250 [Streptomyces sp. NPDC087218]|uniref:hypothetical protein n=1 Tax=Streptomyces sp. NPDC087218 TaxID=3365769 RepID=UPI00381F9DCE